jgi:hypothetical protein
MTTHAFKSQRGRADPLERNLRPPQALGEMMATRTRQRQTARRGERRLHRDPRAARPEPAQDQGRLSAGVQDEAHYACACGHAFSAGVSTSVDCPRCGAGQAW